MGRPVQPRRGAGGDVAARAGPSPERRRAFELVEAVRRGERADDAFARLSAGLDRRQRQFLMELGYGAVRWRGLLDHHLDALLDRGLGSTPHALASILEIGAYQILFMDRVPAYAAVDECVEIARTALPRRTARWAPGVVNGVLRALDRGRDGLPLPDPGTEPVRHLAVRWSHPDWIVERWLARLGPERTAALLARDDEPPAVHLAVHPGRTTAEEERAALEEAGIEVRPHPLDPRALVLGGGVPPDRIPGWAEGRVWAQDVAAQWVVDAAGPPPAGLLLDACAAPGAKLCGVLARGSGETRALALDRDPARLAMVAGNAARLGVGPVLRAAADARAVPTAATFPLVLADVPCSGTGVLRRRADARWRRRPSDLDRFAGYQSEILSGLADRVAPGGTLLYATCSLEPEENQDVVRDFLERRPDFRLDPVGDRVPEAAREGPFLATRPWEADVDGMFAARLVREGR